MVRRGRPRNKGITAFGKCLDKLDISYDEAAQDLDIVRAYVGALARGDMTPSLTLSLKIQSWSEKKGCAVPVESWRIIGATALREIGRPRGKTAKRN